MRGAQRPWFNCTAAMLCPHRILCQIKYPSCPSNKLGVGLAEMTFRTTVTAGTGHKAAGLCSVALNFFWSASEAEHGWTETSPSVRLLDTSCSGSALCAHCPLETLYVGLQSTCLALFSEEASEVMNICFHV